MDGIVYSAASNNGGAPASWHDVAAEWLDDGLAKGVFQWEAMPRVRILMSF